MVISYLKKKHSLTKKTNTFAAKKYQNMNQNPSDQFLDRHIGNANAKQEEMLAKIGVNTLDELIFQTIPDNIRYKNVLPLANPISEFAYLKHIKEIAKKIKYLKAI
jgi:glycine cleavage system pyridoxal-binding protein P